MSSNLKQSTTKIIEYDSFKMTAKPRLFCLGHSELTVSTTYSWEAPFMLQPNDQLTPIIITNIGQGLVVWPDWYFKCDIFLTD